MTDIYQKVIDAQHDGVQAALVTVIHTRGSTPRDTGTKMLVYNDGRIAGTVGGSSVEALVIAEAMEVIRTQKCRRVEHNLNDAGHSDTGMVCGGKMEFFIEPVKSSPRLFIFGGGHVAVPLARLASQTGFSCIVVDDRKEFATKERFPDAEQVIVGDPGKAAAELPIGEQDFVAVVTRCHDHDYTTLRAAIDKPFAYLGLIGSRHKKKQIFERLSKNDGVSSKKLEQVHSPIGIDINARTPEEIAVSIVAELIREKNNAK